MWAEWSVELGPNDPRLQVPWSSPDSVSRYFDLKHDPELIEHLPEAQNSPELRVFLLTLNSHASPFETAKCDLWSNTEISVEEEVFECPWKFSSYIDLLFCDKKRKSFAANESFAKQITSRLRKIDLDRISIELVIRACEYLEAGQPYSSEQSFYMTLYIRGYGQDQQAARQQWGKSLRLIQSMLLA